MLGKLWKWMAVMLSQLCELILSNCFIHFEIIKTGPGEIKALAANPDDLGSIPGTYKVEGEN